MDPVAHFIATTLAAALLSETAKDTYDALKAKLADVFEIKDELAILEKKPGSEPYLQGLAEEIAKKGAAADQDITQLAKALADELKQHKPQDTRTAVLIEQIKNSELEMGDIHTEGSSGVAVRNIEGSKVKIGNVTAKS